MAQDFSLLMKSLYFLSNKGDCRNMFTEFIIIYVLLGVMAALQAAILVLQIVSMRRAANSLPPEMFLMANDPVQLHPSAAPSDMNAEWQEHKNE